MKLLVFMIAMATLPFVLAVWLYHVRGGRRFALAGLVLSVTFIVDINLAGDLTYRGMSNALDLGTVDLAGFGLLLFVLLERRRRGVRYLSPDVAPPVSPVVLAPTLTFAFAVFLALNLVSLVGAEHVGFGLLDFVKLLRGFALFWIAANLVVDDRTAESLPLFLSLFVIVEVAAAAKDYLTGVYWVDATFSHKNSFAFAMNIMLPFLFARALVRPGRRAFFLALFLAGATAVVLSRSRTAWMTMGLGTLVTTALCFLAGARHGGFHVLRRMGSIVVALAALVVPIGVLLADGMMRRWNENAVASFDFRAVHNELALELANTYPLGVGANNYVATIATQFGERLPVVDQTVAHNTYLYVAAEIGWVGLVSYLVLLVAFGAVILRMYRHARSLRALYVSAGAFAGLVASALHSTMESGTMLRRHTYFVWCIVMGLVVAVVQREWTQRPSLLRWILHQRDVHLFPRAARRGAAEARTGRRPA